MFQKFQDSHRKRTLLVCLLLFFSLTYNCEKELIIEKIPEGSGSVTPPDTEEPEEPEITEETADSLIVADTNANQMSHEDSVVIAKLPAYYNFLVHLKESGYSFLDFKSYLLADTFNLPEKLLVIRHDVHSRDIKWAYYACQIEKIVIGSGHSTWYIMLNDPHESAPAQSLYMDLLHHLDSNGMDIQPHISPVDIYIDHRHPEWENYTVDTLRALFNRNYQWDMRDEGRECIITGEDVFDLNEINKELIFLLSKYNQDWTAQTNRQVQGYAAHGSATPMNYVINNAHILDQFDLLNSGVYEYDTYNSKIFRILTYLSDNSLPVWMTNPASISSGRYQFLMHPYQWSHLK